MRPSWRSMRDEDEVEVYIVEDRVVTIDRARQMTLVSGIKRSLTCESRAFHSPLDMCKTVVPKCRIIST